MRIEFFEGTSDGDVLLIYNDDPRAWARLRDHIHRLVEEEVPFLEIHRLPGVEGVELTCRIGNRDAGVNKTRQAAFDYELMATGWDNNEALIVPFARSADGDKSQFLWEGFSSIVPVISTHRGW